MTKRRLTEQEQSYNRRRSELIARCRPEYIADAPFLFANRIQTASMLSRVELFKMAMDIPGAIIECGVYRGNSLMLYLQLSLLLEPYAINRSLYGFDTFAGFRSIDGTFDPDDINEQMFSETDAEVLEQSILLNDLIRPVNRIPRCEIIKGDIVQTVPEFVKNKPELCVAMLILDTDLYQPTKVALQSFLPLMPKGAIVVLDEVAYRNFAGETQALKEVLDFNKVELKRFPYEGSVGYFRI
ncbi:class I SAM-dependent methyltransferase [Bradyrhizobium lablabi]|uniref:TylF/MycF/NovP-related O-methyltransferase n=1 Tax=Bradyrhizobium lablabi TaxID=722472 RepID=UPI001BA641C5|nr:TylF/MycF/NovP-related O-methyltransferase [Bradyrhizobium lablabi]MBR1120196.1 class I SAM-dependent methyltransferase [Bradyrhizobium lablabi]